MSLWKLDRMANQEQLKILLEEGVKAWNDWREDNPDVKPDFVGVSFVAAVLKKADFESANFRKADLYNANLSNAGFCKANLSDCELNRANFKYANLRDTNLRRVQAFATGFIWSGFGK